MADLKRQIKDLVPTLLKSEVTPDAYFVIQNDPTGTSATRRFQYKEIVPTDEILVNTETDFGTPVGDDIQLKDNVTYNLQRKQIIVTHNLLLSPVGSVITNGEIVINKSFKSTSPTGAIEFNKGQIVHSGAEAAFKIDDFSFIRLRNANLISNVGVPLVDADTTGVGLLAGTFQFDIVLLAGFPPGAIASLGIFRNCNVVINGVSGKGFANGFTFIDNANVIATRSGFDTSLNIPGAVFMNFSGTIPNVLLNNVGYTPQSNEYVFEFDSALVYGGIIANNLIYNLSAPGVSEANIFAPGSLDQTTPGIIMKGNTHLNSNTFADIFFQDNVEETVITAIDSPVSINATVYDKVERFQLEHHLDYDTQTVNFTVGQTLTQGLVTGLIIADDDQGTTGTLTLIDVTGGFFQSGVLITDGLGGSANLVKTRGRLKYIDVQGTTLKVTSKTTMQPVTGTNIKVATFIALNNAAIDKSRGKDVVSSTADAEKTLSSQALVDFIFGDYLEAFVSNRQTLSGLYVYDLSFIAGA